MSEETIHGFDFHCHVDLHTDPVAVIDRCASEKIFVLAVTTTPKAWPQNCTWARRNNYVYVAAGLHPELVNERYAEIDLLERQINQSRFVGEVGLDGSQRHRNSYERQTDVFTRVLKVSQKAGGRVLTIHSRSSARDVITMIEKHTAPERVLCILHWFSGSLTDANRAIAAGCYFSINSTMLGYESGRKLVRNLPIDRLLTETDSPFTRTGKHQSVPWDVTTTTTLLAEICGMSATLVKSKLFANAQQVLHFAALELPFSY